MRLYNIIIDLVSVDNLYGWDIDSVLSGPLLLGVIEVDLSVVEKLVEAADDAHDSDRKFTVVTIYLLQVFISLNSEIERLGIQNRGLFLEYYLLGINLA